MVQPVMQPVVQQMAQPVALNQQSAAALLVGEAAAAVAHAGTMLAAPQQVMLDHPEEALRLAQAAAAAAAAAKAEATKEEEKQRRLYRVGLSYRCGRCGKPKKGHVCDMPEDGADGAVMGADGMSATPAGPAILATTIRKGAVPTLITAPVVHAGSMIAAASPSASSPLVHAVGSPLADAKVAGEATTIFKDMVAALGENGVLSPASASGVTPQPSQANGSTGISPLAASAIATGTISTAAQPVAYSQAPVAPPMPTTGGGEPQLSEMDLMLADLAFAARPPPVMTPDEGMEPMANGLGSLSPSNFSPGTMIQQLITPNMSQNGWSSAQMAEMSSPAQVAGARRVAVAAQPSA